MTAWKAKRFWKEAVAEPCDGGFTVRLDARAVKTPAKRLLVVPTFEMASAIAVEWDAQQGLVKPASMPCTRAANSALDKVAVQFDEVVGLLAAYGDADLICYRATNPAELIARQVASWDPLLDWAGSALGAPLKATSGVVHTPQHPESLSRLHAEVAALTPFHLAAFHDIVAITGSLVLALAVTRHKLTLSEAWHLSRIDERWQVEQWGQDDDAERIEALKLQGLLEAGRFYGLCG